PNAVDGASGTVGANGQLTASTTNGAQLTVALNSQNASVSASYTPQGSTTPLQFAGVSDGVTAVSSLVNLSLRSTVGTGSNTLIAGFVINGSDNKSLLIRGIGPTLTALGVSGALQDPVLSLYSGSTLVTSN